MLTYDEMLLVANKYVVVVVVVVGVTMIVLLSHCLPQSPWSLLLLEKQLPGLLL